MSSNAQPQRPVRPTFRIPGLDRSVNYLFDQPAAEVPFWWQRGVFVLVILGIVFVVHGMW